MVIILSIKSFTLALGEGIAFTLFKRSDRVHGLWIHTVPTTLIGCGDSISIATKEDYWNGYSPHSPLFVLHKAPVLSLNSSDPGREKSLLLWVVCVWGGGGLCPCTAVADVAINGKDWSEGLPRQWTQSVTPSICSFTSFITTNAFLSFSFYAALKLQSLHALTIFFSNNILHPLVCNVLLNLYFYSHFSICQILGELYKNMHFIT